MIDRRGQTWEQTYKGDQNGDPDLYLIVGEQEVERYGSCYTLLDLERGTVTWVMRKAIDESWDNDTVKWRRLA